MPNILHLTRYCCWSMCECFLTFTISFMQIVCWCCVFKYWVFLLFHFSFLFFFIKKIFCLWEMGFPALAFHLLSALPKKNRLEREQRIEGINEIFLSTGGLYIKQWLKNSNAVAFPFLSERRKAVKDAVAVNSPYHISCGANRSDPISPSLNSFHSSLL